MAGSAPSKIPTKGHCSSAWHTRSAHALPQMAVMHPLCIGAGCVPKSSLPQRYLLAHAQHHINTATLHLLRSRHSMLGCATAWHSLVTVQTRSLFAVYRLKFGDPGFPGWQMQWGGSLYQTNLWCRRHRPTEELTTNQGPWFSTAKKSQDYAKICWWKPIPFPLKYPQPNKQDGWASAADKDTPLAEAKQNHKDLPLALLEQKYK